MFDNRNTSRIGKIALALVVMIGGIGAFGMASAAPDYQTDYSNDADVLISNETQTTDDLDSVYADIETVTDINNDGTTTSSTDVDFVVMGINESDPTTSNQTELVNETRTINQDSLESFSFEPTSAQKDEFSSFYLHVDMTTSGTSSHINSTDTGALYTSSGMGGGGLLDGTGMSTGAIAVIALGGAALLMRPN